MKIVMSDSLQKTIEEVLEEKTKELETKKLALEEVARELERKKVMTGVMKGGGKGKGNGYHPYHPYWQWQQGQGMFGQGGGDGRGYGPVGFGQDQQLHWVQQQRRQELQQLQQDRQRQQQWQIALDLKKIELEKDKELKRLALEEEKKKRVEKMEQENGAQREIIRLMMMEIIGRREGRGDVNQVGYFGLEVTILWIIQVITWLERGLACCPQWSFGHAHWRPSRLVGLVAGLPVMVSLPPFPWHPSLATSWVTWVAGVLTLFHCWGEWPYLCGLVFAPLPYPLESDLREKPLPVNRWLLPSEDEEDDLAELVMPLDEWMAFALHAWQMFWRVWSAWGGVGG